MDANTTTIITSAITGVLTGGEASLIAPWIHWGIEKKRLKQENRRKLLEITRYELSLVKNVFRFMDSSAFGRIKPHLNADFLERMKVDREATMEEVDYNSYLKEYMRMFLAQLVDLEKKWELI